MGPVKRWKTSRNNNATENLAAVKAAVGTSGSCCKDQLMV